MLSQSIKSDVRHVEAVLRCDVPEQIPGERGRRPGSCSRRSLVDDARKGARLPCGELRAPEGRAHMQGDVVKHVPEAFGQFKATEEGTGMVGHSDGFVMLGIVLCGISAAAGFAFLAACAWALLR